MGTHRIFEGNSKLQDGDIKIELKGMGIGNGLTNPQEQYKWYKEYLCTGAGHAAAMEVCALGFQIPYMATGKNPYDVRIKCEKPPLCYDMSNDVSYLNDKEVQKQLGVDMEFQSCNLIVNKAFTLDFMKNYHMLIPPMLAAGIDVLIYAGDQDFICNWLGNEKWVQALEWGHTKEFNAAV